MARHQAPQPVDPRLEERLKSMEGQITGIGDLTAAINNFKAHLWKTTWPILLFVLPALGVFGQQLYSLNNQVVSHLATETTKLDHLKETDDETGKVLKGQTDKIDATNTKVGNVQIDVARQGVTVDQLKSLAEENKKEVSGLATTVNGIRESVTEIVRSVKDRPIKATETDQSMQIKAVMETNFKALQKQIDTHLDSRLNTRTLSLDLTKDDVEIKPGTSPESLVFTVKSSYDKRDLTADLAEIKPGSKAHILFEDKSPFDSQELIGIASFGPPLQIEVKAFDPASKDRSAGMLRALTNEGSPHVRFTVSLPIKPSN